MGAGAGASGRAWLPSSASLARPAPNTVAYAMRCPPTPGSVAPGRLDLARVGALLVLLSGYGGLGCGVAPAGELVDLEPPPPEDGGEEIDAAGPRDVGAPRPDTGLLDAGRRDTGLRDTGPRDAGFRDAGRPDTGLRDGGRPDTGLRDAGFPDSGLRDAGFPDSGPRDSGLPDAGRPDSGFTPAAHAPLPQIPQQGGPLLRSPAVVTVLPPNYARAMEVISYDDFIVASPWLRTVGLEYGIGNGRHVGVVNWSWAPGPLVDDVEVQTRLLDAVSSGELPATAALGEPFLYMLFFPSSTQITLMGAQSCVAFGGYHNEAHRGALDLVYAVIPDCGGDLGGAISHELFEAASDPFPFTNPSFQYAPVPPDGWSFLGSELADACASSTFLQSGFVVQRIWSNNAARQSRDPCFPASGAPYFSVSEPTNAHTLAAGRSLVINLVAWSTAPVPDWPLVAATIAGDFDAVPMLSATTTNNGRRVSLTVSVPAGTPSGASAFVVVGSGNAAENLYPILITTP